jgi:hypothetical protein
MTSRFLQFLGGPALLLALVSALHAETHRATPTDFAAILETVRPGTVIELTTGNYGNLGLRRGGGSAQAPLVIRSADPKAPARFAGMNLSDVENLVLEGLVFDYVAAPGSESNFRPFQIRSSQGITLRGCLFKGDRALQGGSAEMSPTGFGLSFRGLSDVTLEDSRITGFLRGLIVAESRNLIIRGNEFDGMRSDGMDFAQVEGVLIERNHLHDFDRPPGVKDHPDMIQFWTASTTKPSRDIVIRDNVLNAGGGPWTQSIFMRNELVDARGAGKKMFYRNILIEENVILNAHPHGITVGETLGLTIRNNTVVRNSKAAGQGHKPSFWIPRIRVAKRSEDVRILRNVTASVVGPDGQPDWIVADNLLVQDVNRMKPGFYTTVFGPAALSAPDHIASFAPLPGGPLDRTGIGAARLSALTSRP